MDFIFNKITSKKASAELITILIAILIFGALSGFFTKKILGDKSKGVGIGGAADRVNNVIIKQIP